ncbi:hypothetical protein CRG98_024009 [Punica granatum]|nr:hypothetical protein CRG98_024009 [Punica granatum]
MSQLQMIALLLSALSLFFHGAHSSTVVVDGTSEWKNPIVHVGDVVVFRHKQGNALYIFQNRRAFDLCNFTQASLLTKPSSSSYTWHPSRPGFFYFSFSNGSAATCQQPAQKLAVEVNSAPPSPEILIMPPVSPPQAAPEPASGGVIASSPAFPWPFRPHQELSPSPTPEANSPTMEPSVVPNKADGIPFINSNPAVPLPTGEVDSATIQPQPTSGHEGQVMAGPLQLRMALLWAVMVMMP